MEILQTCIRFPPAPGGAETHVHSISTELAKRGHTIAVHTSDLYKEIPFTRIDDPAPTVDGLPVTRYRGYTLGGELHYVLIPRMLSGLLRAGADLIHAHSYGYFQVNAAAVVRRLTGRPFVLTPHFHPSWSMWGGPKRKQVRAVYDRLIAQPVLDAVDRIIGVSRHEMELLCDALRIDTGKIRVVPNGIDFSHYETIPDGAPFRDEYLGDVPADARVVLYTGRLASNKGLEVLVRAAPAVLAEHPETFFVLVGEDEGMLDRLRELGTERGVWDRFRTTGHVKSGALFRSSYPNADVFVLPSEYEAFGIVLLEAMACEKACIGTRVGGVPEVIAEGETGLVVEYDDAAALAAALCELLADPARCAAMGRAGRERVRGRFTWPAVVDQLEVVYSELVHG